MRRGARTLCRQLLAVVIGARRDAVRRYRRKNTRRLIIQCMRA